MKPVSSSFTASTAALPVANPELLPAVNMESKDSFLGACKQYLKDHDPPNKSHCIPQVMSMLLGKKFVRRLSNLCEKVGFSQFYPAQRDYPIEEPSAFWDEEAKKYLPCLSTISQLQSQMKELKPNEIRYEVLPPREDKNCYSLIYYVGFPTERLPVPILGKIYDWVRPVLYGDKRDWEAIQIDLDRVNKQPIGMSFETSNYSNDPQCYNLLSSKNLHLYTRVTPKANGVWEYKVQQQNGQVRSCEIPNPFAQGTRPELAIVSWNTSLDLCSRVKQNSDLCVYPLEVTEPQFLDIDAYRRNGIDLRVGWLSKQKLVNFSARLPGRVPAESI